MVQRVGKKVKRMCKGCKQPFYIWDYMLRHGENRGKFCNKSCQASWFASQKIVITCKECGRKFKESKRKAIKRKYCSRLCYERAQAAGKTKTNKIKRTRMLSNSFILEAKDDLNNTRKKIEAYGMLAKCRNCYGSQNGCGGQWNVNHKENVGSRLLGFYCADYKSVEGIKFHAYHV